MSRFNVYASGHARQAMYLFALAGGSSLSLIVLCVFATVEVFVKLK